MKKHLWHALMLFMCVFTTCFAQAAKASDKGNIVIKAKDATLEEVFKSLQKSNSFMVYYDKAIVDDQVRVSVEVNEKDINTVMSKVLEQTDYTFSLIDNNIIIKIKRQTQEETKKIVTGTVKSDFGEALPLVNIYIEGTTQGIVSEIDGTYSFKADFEKGQVIVFSLLGYKTKKVVYDGQKVIDVALTESISTLNDVVVTGYQTISKERVAGSYSILGEKELNSKIATNALEKIVNVSSGMMINNENQVQIRGINTFFSDKQPLIVIDGFPVEKVNKNGYVLALDVLNEMNPDDIENITILKDASAASIYGVRASNGVIVITTKRGSKDTFNVSLNNQTSFNSPSSIADLDRASTKDVVDLALSRLDAGITTYHEIDNPKYYRNDDLSHLYARRKAELISETQFQAELNKLYDRDYVQEFADYFYRESLSVNNSVSINGNNKNYLYSLSTTHQYEHPHLIGNHNNRYNINFRNEYRINDKFRTVINLYHNTYVGKSYGHSSINSYSIYSTMWDENGNGRDPKPAYTEEGWQKIESDGLIRNDRIVSDEYLKNEFISKSTSNRLQVQLDWDIFKNVNFQTRYQISTGNTVNENYIAEDYYQVINEYNKYTTVEKIDVNGVEKSLITNYLPWGGQLHRNTSEYKNHNWQTTLRYNFKIAGDHNITGLVGTELKELNYLYHKDKSKYGYNEELLSHVPVKDERKTYNGNSENSPYGLPSEILQTQNRFVSIYTNFAYSYKSKYVLTGNMRIDQTNLFGQDPKYRYRPLWSLGAAYNIHKEEWFEVPIINRLKLKGSYGLTGNVNRQYGPYLKMKAEPDAQGNITGTITSPANDRLRWEKTEKINIGFESSFLSNKFQLDFEYYHDTSSDLLGHIPLDPTYGFHMAVINALSMQNKGWEFSTRAMLYSSKDLNVRLAMIASSNKNKITKYFTSNPTASYLISGYHRLKNDPINAIYAYRFNGLNETGFPTFKVKDDEIVEGHLSNISNTADDVYLAGVIDPKVFGNIRPGVTYKNFDLETTISYRFGHLFQPSYYNGFNIYGFAHPDMGNRWMKEGDEKNTNIPREISIFGEQRSSLYAYSDHLLEKADNITLDNIRLTYQINQLAFMKSLRVSMQVSNLGLIWAANKYGENPNLYRNMNYHNRNQTVAPLKPTYTLSLNINL